MNNFTQITKIQFRSYLLLSSSVFHLLSPSHLLPGRSLLYHLPLPTRKFNGPSGCAIPMKIDKQQHCQKSSAFSLLSVLRYGRLEVKGAIPLPYQNCLFDLLNHLRLHVITAKSIVTMATTMLVRLSVKLDFKSFFSRGSFSLSSGFFFCQLNSPFRLFNQSRTCESFVKK